MTGTGKPSMMDKAKDMLHKVEEKLPGGQKTAGTHDTAHTTGTHATGLTSSTTTGAHPTHQHATYGTTAAPVGSGVTHSTTPGEHVIGTHPTSHTTGTHTTGAYSTPTEHVTGTHGATHPGTTHAQPTMMDKAKGMVEKVEAKLPGQHSTTGQHTGTGVHDSTYGTTGGTHYSTATVGAPGHTDPHGVTGFSGTGATTGTQGLHAHGANTTYGTGATTGTHGQGTHSPYAQAVDTMYGSGTGTGAHNTNYGTTGGVQHTGAHQPTMMDKAKGLVQKVEEKLPGQHGTTGQHATAGTHNTGYTDPAGTTRLGQSSDTYTPHHGGI